MTPAAPDFVPDTGMGRQLARLEEAVRENAVTSKRLEGSIERIAGIVEKQSESIAVLRTSQGRIPFGQFMLLATAVTTVVGVIGAMFVLPLQKDISGLQTTTDIRFRSNEDALKDIQVNGSPNVKYRLSIAEEEIKKVVDSGSPAVQLQLAQIRDQQQYQDETEARGVARLTQLENTFHAHWEHDEAVEKARLQETIQDLKEQLKAVQARSAPPMPPPPSSRP